ncbi:MAG: hypothetical protein A2X22_07715 [Bacteroidetes bacterium GWF2_49_14]|nr:MAG: hypothetical protein A2X22_07715 [Bacteroidetes bacterium GWF2_49_14]HBB92914.1 hypothetical protein [Bacteroidales bacterium]
MSKNLTITLLLATLFTAAVAQKPADTIDLSRISQKSVRGLVIKEKVRSTQDFQCLNTSCYQAEDSLKFKRHLKSYRIRASLDDVWNKYSSVSPRDAWTGKRVKFGFLFNRFQDAFIYPEEAASPMNVGSIIYVNLKLLLGLKNLGVAFEVTGLDPEKKIIRFCYLKDGISKGSQEIRFTSEPDGTTVVTHDTRYHSGSRFRDQALYPRFHEQLVGEFHENLRRIIEGG